MPEIFRYITLQFIDATLRFAAVMQADNLRRGSRFETSPLHLHLADFAIQQMALEAVS
jgi:hypothetical protein